MARILQQLKNFFLVPQEEHSSQTDTTQILNIIRERIVTVLLRLCMLFGLLSVSVGTWAALENQDWISIIVGNLSLLGVVILAVRRRIDYRIRTIALVLIAYFFIFLNLREVFTEFTFAVLFAFVVMTTLLMGRRGGILAFFLSVLTIFFANHQYFAGQIEFFLSMAAFDEPFPIILVIYTDWLFYVGIFFFTIWIYFDGFSIAWERERTAIKLLAQERDRLAEVVSREKTLMEKLNLAHQREIELSRMKSQIITTVSHEFRTPLTVIGNSVELLTRYRHNFDAKKQEAIHQRIKDSFDYLTELLQDASLVNQAYAQGFEAKKRPFPFNGLAQRLKKELLQTHQDPPNVTFFYEDGEETAVCIDYDFVYRVTNTFLQNAFKYSPDGSPISITLQLDEQLTIHVCDEGVGLLPDEAQQIWELFFRGATIAEKQGIGFGLYLAKRLARAMDGTVTAVSPGPNMGSTFSLHIPNQPC